MIIFFSIKYHVFDAVFLFYNKWFYNKCWGQHQIGLTSTLFFCNIKAYEARMLYNKSVQALKKG